MYSSAAINYIKIMKFFLKQWNENALCEFDEGQMKLHNCLLLKPSESSEEAS